MAVSAHGGKWRAEKPPGPATLASAPLCSNNAVMSASPVRTASVSAVPPKAEAFTSAPFSIINFSSAAFPG